ncbi:hypothetical protein D3C81_1409130 [compost metagenome]
MSLDDVPAKAPAGGHGPLQIHFAPAAQLLQVAVAVGLRHDINGKRMLADRGRRQADTIDGYAIADFQITHNERGADIQHHHLTAAADAAQHANLLDQSGEHVIPS